VTQIPFRDGVFTWPLDDPQLIGGRCEDCSSVTFPVPLSCARCGGLRVAEHLLARTGTLWTFTTQDFLPKEPYAGGETAETFAGYGVGMVELGGEVRVEGRLTVADADQLRIGMELRLVVVPFRQEPDGTTVLTYAFEPVVAEPIEAPGGAR
jgi:uncharacterized OB-fold protein